MLLSLGGVSLNPHPLPSSSGAEAGVEGNQRTAGPSVPLHELPEAGRGGPRAAVLPGSRYKSIPNICISSTNKPGRHKVPRINLHIFTFDRGRLQLQDSQCDLVRGKQMGINNT